MVKDYEPAYYAGDHDPLPDCEKRHAGTACDCGWEPEPAPRAFPGEHLTDRELLLEIHEFIGNIHGLLPMVAPALEGISKSPIGKMLGIR